MGTFFLSLLTSSISQAAFAAIEGELATALASPDPLGAMAAVNAKLDVSLKDHPLALEAATKIVDALIHISEVVASKAILKPPAA